jgi:hypothetical protein
MRTDTDTILAELKGLGNTHTLQGVIALCELEISKTQKEWEEAVGVETMKECQGRIRGLRKIIKLITQIS